MPPTAYIMTLQALVYEAMPLHPRFPPFSYPTSRNPEPSRNVPKHFKIALRATFATQLLKNVMMDFVVWRLILNIKVSIIQFAVGACYTGSFLLYIFEPFFYILLIFF